MSCFYTGSDPAVANLPCTCTCARSTALPAIFCVVVIVLSYLYKSRSVFVFSCFS